MWIFVTFKMIKACYANIINLFPYITNIIKKTGVTWCGVLWKLSSCHQESILFYYQVSAQIAMDL